MTADRFEGALTACAAQGDLYVLPAGRHHLVYAPLHRTMAMINTKALDDLKRRMVTASGSSSTLPQDDIGDLINRLDAKPCYPYQRTGEIDPVFLGIIPTRACNLSCLYCNFGSRHAPDASLDIHQACAAVEWMARHAARKGKTCLDIHFFGGEPFVAGDVIEAVVHRARFMAAGLGLIPRFEVATNGVFDDGRAQFVGDYFDTVVLSCDGFQRFHDGQRPMAGGSGSFTRVRQTAERLRHATADLCLRICVTRENLDQLEPFARWFGATFKPSIINIETLKPTPESKSHGLAPPDPFEFAARCVNTCRSIRAMGIDAVYAAADISSVKRTFCPVGQDAAILSPDGRISSCYLPEPDWQARGLDMNIGLQKAGGDMVIDSSSLNRLRVLVTDKPRCQRCFCRWTCAGGCHVSETYPGCDSGFTDFCIQTRLITACFLLEQLAMPDMADDILADHAAMDALVFQPGDTLEPG